MRKKKKERLQLNRYKIKKKAVKPQIKKYLTIYF